MDLLTFICTCCQNNTNDTLMTGLLALTKKYFKYFVWIFRIKKNNDTYSSTHKKTTTTRYYCYRYLNVISSLIAWPLIFSLKIIFSVIMHFAWIFFLIFLKRFYCYIKCIFHASLHIIITIYFKSSIYQTRRTVRQF